MSSTYCCRVFSSGSPRKAAGPVTDSTEPILIGSAAKAPKAPRARAVPATSFLMLCFMGLSPLLEFELNTLDHHGDPLPDTNTHGAQGIAAATALEFVSRGRHQAGAAHTERMPQGDGTAIGIDAGLVVGQTEVAHHGQALCGESLIQLDDL